MVVNVGFRICVLVHFGQPAVQLLEPWKGIGVRVQAQIAGLLAQVLLFFLKPGSLGGGSKIQLLLNLRQQVVIKERRDFVPHQPHDPVQAEVEIASVQLEHLTQERS